MNYAEMKAIASGNPLVMEKIRIDTEVRKLDVLRATHLNQQFAIGKQVRDLPEQIARIKQYHSGLLDDIEQRNTHGSQDFTMQIGQQMYNGKKSREMAAEALLKPLLVLSYPYAAVNKQALFINLLGDPGCRESVWSGSFPELS